MVNTDHHPIDMSSKDHSSHLNAKVYPPTNHKISSPSNLHITPSTHSQISPQSNIPISTSFQADISAPPLTKLVHRKPSNPREFFEKLYGPDTTKESPMNQPPSHLCVQRPSSESSLNSPPPGLPFISPSYLPTFPLTHHEAGMENIPFPGGLAAYLARRARKDARARRQRTTFSQSQTALLEVEYTGTEYISRPRRCQLAESLQLSETQIKIWFQNRRAKDKRIEKAQSDQQFRYFTMAGLSLPSPYPFPTSLSADLPSLLPLSHNKEHIFLPGDHKEERQDHHQHYQLHKHPHQLLNDNEKQFKQENSPG